MSTSKKRIETKRRYSEEFRRSRVKEFERGTFSVGQLSRLYGMCEQSVYRWIEKYSDMPKKNAVIVEVPNSQSARLQGLERKVAELERALGQKQILLDYQVCMLEYLEGTGIDVKKKLSNMEGWKGFSSKTSKL